MSRLTQMLFGTVMAAGLALAPQIASAQERIRVGTLDCNVSSGIGLIVTSQRQVRCVFSPSVRARREVYYGRINRFGLDVGVTGRGVLVWAVFAPTNRLAPGQLSGNYAGGSAAATVGVGAGANLLVGGSANTIALQPLSVEAQTGLNVALGVSSLTLRRGR